MAGIPKHNKEYYENLIIEYGPDCQKYLGKLNADTFMEYLRAIGYALDFGVKTLRRNISEEEFEKITNGSMDPVGLPEGRPIDGYFTASGFDFNRYYENNKGRAFCGIDALGREMNRLRKCEADLKNECNKQRRVIRDQQKEINDLRESKKAAFDNFAVEKEKAMTSKRELAMAIKEKEKLQSFIDGQYDDFSRIHKELMVGNDPIFSDFQAEHSFLGESDQQTPSLAVIQQRYHVESGTDELENLFSMEN